MTSIENYVDAEIFKDFFFDSEKLRKPPSKEANFSFCSTVSVLPKSAQCASTFENSHSFFNVSYTWYESLVITYLDFYNKQMS